MASFARESQSARATDELRDVAPAPDETFGDRLAEAIARKGWSLAETAREISRYLPDGEIFNPVNLSHYMHGRSFPRRKYQAAIMKALDLGEPLIRQRQTRKRSIPEQWEQGQGAASILSVQDMRDGTARVQIDQVLPWPHALKLLQVLKQDS